MDAFRSVALKALNAAEAARSVQNPNLAKILQGISDHFTSRANSLADPVIDAQTKLAEATKFWNEGLGKLERQVSSLVGVKGAKALGPIADAIAAGPAWHEAITTGNTSELAKVSTGILLGEVFGSAAFGIATLGFGLEASIGVVVGAAIFSIAGAIFGYDVVGEVFAQSIGWWTGFFNAYQQNKGLSLFDRLAAAFNSAQRWTQPRRDPLTLDLNGNGLETVAPQTPPILFDHSGNGLKQSTGWVAPNDGFLVMDRNGNGTIDSGAELFGDSTPLATGGNAVDGFDALAQEDTNGDGVVNAQDANWTNLQVWQDLNQDGISQSGELSSLDALGITGINTGSTTNSQVLPNGNQIADKGTFTYAIPANDDVWRVAA